ncbi:phosphoprotein [Rhinolophus rhabdovirus DPuer]|nr:phosphoprotein [Rhinolophus rhabdovirus DPuer]
MKKIQRAIMNASRSEVKALSTAINWEGVRANLAQVEDSDEESPDPVAIKPTETQEWSENPVEQLDRPLVIEDSDSDDSDFQVPPEDPMEDSTGPPSLETKENSIDAEEERKEALRSASCEIMIRRYPIQMVKTQSDLDDLLADLAHDLLSSVDIKVRSDLRKVDREFIRIYHVGKPKAQDEIPGPSPPTACPPKKPNPPKEQPTVPPANKEEAPAEDIYKELIRAFSEGLFFKKRRGGRMKVTIENEKLCNINWQEIANESNTLEDAKLKVLKRSGLWKAIKVLCDV